MSATIDHRIAQIRGLIRDVPDFPKPGILFRDITPMLGDPQAFTACVELLAERFADQRLDAIVGVESRGFIFAAALATRMKVSFVPARKPGKLPAATDKVSYALEYGTDSLEMHKDAIRAGARVLLVDDLIATGGTAWAAIELATRQGGHVVSAAFVIELTALGGAARIAPVEAFSLLKY